MGYGKKHTEDEGFILERIKDFSKLIPGAKYHLRKLISMEGNCVKDEVYDIILKEYKEGFLIEEGTEKQFPVTEKEFEIFVRRK